MYLLSEGYATTSSVTWRVFTFYPLIPYNVGVMYV